jgi:hypothetical protein
VAVGSGDHTVEQAYAGCVEAAKIPIPATATTATTATPRRRLRRRSRNERSS